MCIVLVLMADMCMARQERITLRAHAQSACPLFVELIQNIYSWSASVFTREIDRTMQHTFTDHTEAYG